MIKTVAFQGALGAYSHLACQEVFPKAKYLPCTTFFDAFETVQNGVADYAVIPIENSNAGRVADVHSLLSQTPLQIIGEHFLRIEHQLLGLESATLSDIKTATSHPQALAQCSSFLQQNNITSIAQNDTASSCEIIKEQGDKSVAAIASQTAAEIYKLKILVSNIENSKNNTTRFLIISNKQPVIENDGNKFITSLLFNTKNIPSALYTALGCFAKQNLNLIKIESYILNDKFVSAQFYLEIEAHQECPKFQKALNDLDKISNKISILGSYKAHPHRYL